MFIFFFFKAYRVLLENFILGSFGRFKISMDEMFKIEPNKKPWVQFFSDFSHFGHLPFANNHLLAMVLQLHGHNTIHGNT